MSSKLLTDYERYEIAKAQSGIAFAVHTAVGFLYALVEKCRA